VRRGFVLRTIIADILMGGSSAGSPATPVAHFCRGLRRAIFQPSGPDGALRTAPDDPPTSKQARPPNRRIGRVDRIMTVDMPVGAKPAGEPAKPSAHR
jgi:hypothetical protein